MSLAQRTYVFPDGKQHRITEADIARFEAKIDKGTCWKWTSSLMHGYGRFRLAGVKIRAHRFAYVTSVGPIPDGLVLDHLCRTRSCVNPAHLEPVTIGENVMRGQTIGARNAVKTHCPAGHPYVGDNLYVMPSGKRVCRQCRRDREALARAAAKAVQS